MKKLPILILTVLLSFCTAFADDTDRRKMKEDIQKFKVNYIAQEIKLSEKEKEEFTPLYNEYDAEIRKSGAEAFKFERELKKKKDATDEDYKKLAELQKKSRENFNRIAKKYDEKFEKILTAKQIYTMHKAEEKFFEKMKEMRKKHKGNSHKNKKHNGNVSKEKKGKAAPPSPNEQPAPAEP